MDDANLEDEKIEERLDDEELSELTEGTETEADDDEVLMLD